ncbi:CCCH RNA binding domain-containing protein [Cryptosporidium canis]|uniref:CCCH RNA binding domain-containing protein n=1 Tax=Cryptosporidium canis TaxID=195482 RepID=A0A9D5DGA6_9CRYT|nr:CCCH RNA binding domain-containing protein [Cryptosporidium canis]
MRKDRNSLSISTNTIVRRKLGNEANLMEMQHSMIENNTLANHIYGSEDSNKKHYLLTIYELYVFRTVVCSSHLQGKCEHSDSCPFSHCLTWQRRNPNEHYYSPKLCPEICFVKNNEKMNLIRRCRKGKLCTFAHSKEEQLYHPLMYKTKECSLYPNCNRYYCPFSHGVEQIRNPDEVRESIEQVTRNISKGILRDPYTLLSNIVNSRNRANYDIKSNKSNVKSNPEITKSKKDTFLKSKHQNSTSSSHLINNNPPIEENVINSIWDSVESWNLNASHLNFHPAFVEIMSFNEQDQHPTNPEFNPCTFNNITFENKYESEYDQIWKEISTECSKKKL